MLSLFPVACSKFGASSLKAAVSATDVNTLISAALLATAANKHDIKPPTAISAMRFANDVWIMHPSHEINFSYSIISSARSGNDSDSQPCFARRLGGVSGGKETQGWRDSSHTAMVGAGKFGSAKLPMATAT